jgi:hypothetical protein
MDVIIEIPSNIRTVAATSDGGARELVKFSFIHSEGKKTLARFKKNIRLLQSANLCFVT